MTGVPAAALGLLGCPRCGGPLGAGDGRLRCGSCRAGYEVRDGVPDLVPWGDAEPGPEWAAWHRKLELLKRWRRETWDGSDVAEGRRETADEVARELFAFVRFPEGGWVVEVGCGDAHLRRHLAGRHYLGVDPFPVAAPGWDGGGAEESVLVRGVGERLPLTDSRFEAALLCETLDHCMDPRGVLREVGRVLKPGGIVGVMQSVPRAPHAEPVAVRLRAAAGRLRDRVLGRRRVDAADTKTHPMDAEQLAALVRSVFEVDETRRRGPAFYLRARRRGR